LTSSLSHLWKLHKPKKAQGDASGESRRYKALWGHVPQPSTCGTHLTIQDYDEALSFNPEDIHLRFGRGHEYYIDGQYERAIPDFDEAIRLRPEFHFAYRARGLIFEGLGRSKKAERDFAKARELGYDR
jgi:regulator of sirC expression with transglutaminase-like and TPR domain